MVLIAQDVPALEKPTARTLNWIERKWLERQRGRDTDTKPFDADQQVERSDSSTKTVA